MIGCGTGGLADIDEIHDRVDRPTAMHALQHPVRVDAIPHRETTPGSLDCHCRVDQHSVEVEKHGLVFATPIRAPEMVTVGLVVHWAVQPPSTTSDDPVIIDAAGETR